jgi:hypothetical protein
MMLVLVELLAALLLAVLAAAPVGGERHALPPPPPGSKLSGTVLFADDFSNGSLEHWRGDRDDVWSVKRGMLRADLPDRKQEHALLYAGDEAWMDVALDFDVCAMRGADKGAVVRVEGGSGIGIDLRGPGYQDVLIHRREWPMGKARVANPNGVWHHVRIEAKGHRYRVIVNGDLVLDKLDRRSSRPRGRIALAAYTGGVGECTVYYDNIVVTSLP